MSRVSTLRGVAGRTFFIRFLYQVRAQAKRVTGQAHLKDFYPFTLPFASQIAKSPGL